MVGLFFILNVLYLEISGGSGSEGLARARLVALYKLVVIRIWLCGTNIVFGPGWLEAYEEITLADLLEQVSGQMYMEV